MGYKYLPFGHLYYLFSHLVEVRRICHHIVGYAGDITIKSAYITTRVNKGRKAIDDLQTIVNKYGYVNNSSLRMAEFLPTGFYIYNGEHKG